jgi:hypothetical protein
LAGILLPKHGFKQGVRLLNSAFPENENIAMPKFIKQ